MEELRKRIEERFDYLFRADRECLEGAKRKHDFEGQRHFEKAIFFTERARDVVMEEFDEFNN